MGMFAKLRKGMLISMASQNTVTRSLKCYIGCQYPLSRKKVYKQNKDMTLNDYSILVAKHGEEWVRKIFPRSVKDLERRLRLKEDTAHGT